MARHSLKLHIARHIDITENSDDDLMALADALKAGESK